MIIFPENPDLTTSEVQNKLISSLQEVNKAIKSRLITLSLMFLIAVGFLFHSSNNDSKSMEYYTYITSLTKLIDTADLKTYMSNHENDIVEDLYHIIDMEAVFYKVKASNYQDKLPIVEAISELKRIRRGYFTGLNEQMISLFGIEVPLSPLISISTLILLFIYHDYALKMYHRQRLLSFIKQSKIPDWYIGHEALSLENFSSLKSYSISFFSSLSRIMASVINVLVLISGICYTIIITSSYRFGASQILGTMSGFFLAILAIEVVIVCFQNNFFQLGEICMIFHSLFKDGGTRKWSRGKIIGFRILWPFIVLSIHIFLAYEGRYLFSMDFGIMCLMLLSMCFLLPLSYFITEVFSNSRISHILFFTGIVSQVFWVILVPLTFIFFRSSRSDLKDLTELAFWVMIVGAIVSIFYAELAQKVKQNMPKEG
jgi:hypothetical protein